MIFMDAWLLFSVLFSGLSVAFTFSFLLFLEGLSVLFFQFRCIFLGRVCGFNS